MRARYAPSFHEELLAETIVDCAYIVHTALGPELPEAVYEHCFCYELKKRDVPHRRQVSVPLVYDGNRLSWGLRLDMLVGERIVCELKSVETRTPVFMAQILTQLRLVDLHIGFLINFNVSLIKEAIWRVIR
jgi:GxxExxY protein